jgi:hypothetical protein
VTVWGCVEAPFLTFWVIFSTDDLFRKYFLGQKFKGSIYYVWKKTRDDQKKIRCDRVQYACFRRCIKHDEEDEILREIEKI